MALPISRSAVDKLGKLLVAGTMAPEDWQRLEEVLSAYQESLDSAQAILTDAGLQPTTRVKSTGTLIEKPRRGTSMKSIQDIAGARLVVSGGRPAQDAVVSRVRILLGGEGEAAPKTVDRRANPTHGYRAVHVIAHHNGLPVELQVRTELQDSWAQLVERVGDMWGRGLRYGTSLNEPLRPLFPGGRVTRSDFVGSLMNLSESLSRLETNEGVLRWLSAPRREGILENVSLRLSYSELAAEMHGLRSRVVGQLDTLAELLDQMEAS